MSFLGVITFYLSQKKKLTFHRNYCKRISETTNDGIMIFCSSVKFKSMISYLWINFDKHGILIVYLFDGPPDIMVTIWSTHIIFKNLDYALSLN